MSLSKQLGIGIFCVVLMMFIGTLWSNTANTRSFISSQLSTQAQDTAVSLSSQLTPYIGNVRELITVETITNEVFDRGYFAALTLSDHDGKIIINRTNLINSENVPAWFIKVFNIDAPTATAEIRDGWVIKGRLLVRGNAGFGYQQLWSNALSSFWITLCVFGIALIFVWLLVKFIISKPINAVIEQTEAISMQRFTQITDVPRTTELKKFVNAVNFMSTKLSSLFGQLSEQSEQYRQFAYADPLTKVGNRRAFELYMEHLFRDEVESSSGHLLIIRASSLGEVQKRYGGNIGDKYLVDVGATTKKILAQYFDEFSVYRVSGADFAVIIEKTKTAQIIALAKTLATAFKRMEKTEYSQGTAHIGVSSFAYNDDTASLMEQTDNALSVAKDNDERWELSDNLPVTFSNEVWRDKIKAILHSGHSDFVAQPIVNAKHAVEYSEWFARLPNDENSANLPMAQLIPASIRLDHAQELDQLIVSNLLEKLQNSPSKVGVNLSRLSIFDVEFMDWLVTQLQQVGDRCQNLVIEIPERALVHDIEDLLTQVNILKSMGVKIAVERFGAQLAGIRYLGRLAPHYLKIDGRYTKNIHTEIDNQLFIASLINIAHGLNIEVIAEMVETQAEHDWLMAAQVDYFQGYFIAPPKLVEESD